LALSGHCAQCRNQLQSGSIEKDEKQEQQQQQQQAAATITAAETINFCPYWVSSQPSWHGHTYIPMCT